MKSVKCTLKIVQSSGTPINASIQAIVQARYMNKDCKVVCPISQLRITDTGESIDHSHIIPKNHRHNYGSGVLDGADNIIPTFPALHTQMELHQHTPSISFEFVREDDVDYDLYKLLFAKHVDSGHVVHRYITHKNLVRLHRSSREYLLMHCRVFKECDETNDADIASLELSRENLRQACVQNAITKGIVNAMLSRLTRTLKKKKKFNSKTAESVIASWLESKSISVSGSLWDYEDEAEQPQTVTCKVLHYNLKSNLVELICTDEYDEEDISMFLSQYQPGSARIAKGLSRFDVWSLNPELLEPHVLKIEMTDTGTGTIKEIPIGTVFFNYTKGMGFSEMRVDSFNDVTSLYVVVSGEVECCMTPGQVNELIKGEIPDFESLRNRLVMTRISDGEYTVSKLLDAQDGIVTVQLYERTKSGSASRPSSWITDKYLPLWTTSKKRKVSARAQNRSLQWRPLVEEKPLVDFFGISFTLYNGQIPSSMHKSIEALQKPGPDVGHSTLGKRISKAFGAEMHNGYVSAVFPGVEDDTEEMYHVIYEDGDSEDLHAAELK